MTGVVYDGRTMKAPSTSLQMSATATSAAPTEQSKIDEAVAALKERAVEFARLAPMAKAQLIGECIPRLLAVAPAWVVDGARVRGADPSEEWLAGPTTTLRMFRLLAQSLDQIAQAGKPALGRGTRRRPDGRLEISLFPASTLDGILYGGFTGHVLMAPGIDERLAREHQAEFYARKDPEGGVSLVLGAGNVSSIPPMDVATKMFIEGLRLHPQDEPGERVGGPAPRARAGAADRAAATCASSTAAPRSGSYCCYHPLVDDVHITGSDRTHDTIVWGPPGPERERRHGRERSAAEEADLVRARQREPGGDRPVRLQRRASSGSRRATS